MSALCAAILLAAAELSAAAILLATFCGCDTAGDFLLCGTAGTGGCDTADGCDTVGAATILLALAAAILLAQQTSEKLRVLTDGGPSPPIGDSGPPCVSRVPKK